MEEVEDEDKVIDDFDLGDCDSDVEEDGIKALPVAGASSNEESPGRMRTFESTDDYWGADTASDGRSDPFREVARAGFGNMVNLEGSLRKHKQRKLSRIARTNSFAAGGTPQRQKIMVPRSNTMTSPQKAKSLGPLPKTLSVSSMNPKMRYMQGNDLDDSTVMSDGEISIFNSTGSIPDNRASHRGSVLSNEDSEGEIIAKSMSLEAKRGRSLSQNRQNSLQYKILKTSTMSLTKVRKTKVVTKAKNCTVDFTLTYHSVWLLLVLWRLFIDDVRVAAFTAEADQTIFALTWIMFALFWTEIFVASILVPNYYGSANFWLDTLAATSTLPFEALGTSRGAKVYTILRSFRAASMALKASQYIRETFDTIKAKMHKKTLAHGVWGQESADSANKQQGEWGKFTNSFQTAKLGLSPTLRARRRSVTNATGEDLILRQSDALNDQSKSSIIGERLVHITKVKTLLVLYAMFFAVGVFGSLVPYDAEFVGLNMLDKSLEKDDGVSNRDFVETLGREFVKSIEKSIGTGLEVVRQRKVLSLKVHNLTIIDKGLGEGSALRANDYVNVSTNADRSILVLSVRETNTALATNSAVMSVIILIGCLLWDQMFLRDYKRYIVDPIYNIIGALGRLASDPRLAVEMASQNVVIDEEHPTEIEMIGNAIAKFGRLLHVGFGEAGVEIISRNLRRGVFDPVAKGRKVNAIFGFCDIRNFTDLCEVLRQDTMQFTNMIAEIVHEECHNRNGDVNKNIGDAFLVVWKVKALRGESKGVTRQNSTDTGYEKKVVKRERRPSLYVHHLTKEKNIVDQALLSFASIREALECNEDIQNYAENPVLQERLPKFRIRLGYGMHVGWAIEGAIGSRHKVDASYLSPHVNISARLEAATKQYGVSLLLSEAFYSELTPTMQEECRGLDRVTLKGSAVPMSLYTYDPDSRHSSLSVDVKHIFSDESSGTAAAEEGESKDVMHNITKVRCQSLADSKNQYQNYSSKRLWTSVFTAYRAGFWGKCQEVLAIYRLRHPDDSPSKVMWSYMKEREFVPPKELRAGEYFFKPLTSK
eukprot:g8125.t1